MIPEEVIAQIKERVDLASVVGRTVALKKVGRNLVGLCPFHKEKSPSFNVHADDGYYYCFGCRASGDVVTFLEKTTGKSFRDVIEDLAKDAGVEIPEDDVDPQERARRAERAKLGRVLDLAQMFFRARLTGKEGAAARAYLHDVRKLDDDTIDKFGVGFGGTGDPSLVAFLEGQGVATDDGITAGVLGRSQEDPSRGPYDFFRHRVTFPIRDARGQIVAFGGRIFGEMAEGRPKYVNSRESPLYEKSRVLYGLFEALPALKQGRPAVVVEGYLDVIALHKAGIQAGVAPCGTALTPLHIDELKRRTPRAVLAMDADAAGQAASEKALLSFLQADVDVALCVLPEKDPDDMVRSGQADRLKTLVDGAPSALDALVARAREEGQGSVRARIAAIDKLLPFLAAPPRELVRSELVKAAARALNEDERVLHAEVEKRGRKLLGEKVRRGPPAPRPGAPAASSSSAPPSGSARPRDDDPRDDDAAPRRRPPPARRPFTDAERTIARVVLLYPEVAPMCGVLVEEMRNAELKSFIGRLLDELVRRHDADPRTVVKGVGVRPGSEIAELAADIQRRNGFADPRLVMPEQRAVQLVEELILSLDRRVVAARLQEVGRALAAADERKDEAAVKVFLAEQQVLVRAVRELDGAVGGPADPTPAAPLAAVVPLVLPAPPAPPPDEAPPAPSSTTAVHEPDAPWDDEDPEDDPWG